MTPKEHLLLLTLIAKQAQHINLLLNVLKSRGIVTGDDARAFEFAASVDARANAALLQREKDSYLQVARGLGLETGLETLPPLSEDDFAPES
jgi:hypothetical protein